MEKILIDGYNLLYKDGALKNLAERSLESARDQLIGMIAAWRSGETEVQIVFDGRNSDGARRAASHRGIEVLFSRYPQTADEVILGIVDKERRRSSLTVVTSDEKDIGRVARAEGARWISSEKFIRRLRRSKGRPAATGEKPLTTSPEEMAYWLQRFGTGAREKK
jgi:uncharacterized protein